MVIETMQEGPPRVGCVPQENGMRIVETGGLQHQFNGDTRSSHLAEFSTMYMCGRVDLHKQQTRV